MALRFTFGTTPGGSFRNASDLDQQFTDVALFGLIPGTIVGTNALTFTPAVNTPVLAAYQNFVSVGAVAVANSTGAVTLQYGALAALPVFLQDGVTQAGSGDIKAGVFHIYTYVSGYNSGGGGWSLTGDQPANMPDISALTLTDNPASTGYVAGSIGGGSANNRKFRLGEVGGWSVLDEQVAAGSANLTFNFATAVDTGLFDDFRFIGAYLAPANDSVDLWVRTSPDGSSFDSGASNYGYITFETTPAGINGQNSAGDTKIIVNSANTLGNSTQENMSFELTLFNAPQTAAFTTLNWTFGLESAVPNLCSGLGSGRRLAAAAVKGMQFQASAGNLASGRITLLGRRRIE